jgi:hypothetical protein
MKFQARAIDILLCMLLPKQGVCLLGKVTTLLANLNMALRYDSIVLISKCLEIIS